MPRIDGVKVLAGHRKNCRACQSQSFPGNPLWLPRNPVRMHRLDSIGRQLNPTKAGWMWVEFACNSLDCPAKVLIRYDLLTRFAHAKMLEAKEARRG